MKAGNCCCNVLWFLFAGLHLGLFWCILGCLWCITIVGIPFGLQAIKIGCFIIWPFGKDIVEKEGGADGCDCFLNFLWIILGGFILCFVALLEGLIFCVTIIGIPCGLQLFKLAKISLVPFGRKVVEEGEGGVTIVNNVTTLQPIVVVQPTQGPVNGPPQFVSPPPQYNPPQVNTPNNNYI